VTFRCNMLSEVAALTAETTNNREIETQITAAERVQHK
jgi:hypothetical protein